MQTSDYERMIRMLSSSLSLVQSPVAICLTDKPPETLPAHEGRVPAGCAFWQHAAQRAFVTSPADHSLCSVGVYTHNLEPGPLQESELAAALGVFAQLGYVRPEDVPLVPALKSRPRYISYTPLDRTPATPDVVLLFLRPADALIVSEACQQVEGGNPPAMGRPACAAIPQVVNTGAAAYSLGCCGARAYLDVFADDVAIFALPGAKLQSYVDRIEALSKANTILRQFHGIRRREVEAGGNPTISESLAAMQG